MISPFVRRAGKPLTALLLAIAWLLFPGSTLRAASPVIISEFVASNSGGLTDEDGDHPDWIELFNTSTNTVNLNGWYLTDAANKLTKWKMPSTNLPPNGFMIVFASGKDRAVPGRPLHSNFSLSAGGEYLALVLPDGVTIATQFAPTFPPQYTDISYGLGQQIQVIHLMAANAPATVFIPTNGNLGLTWVATNFNDSAWLAGTNGVGFEAYTPGFAVRNVIANVGVCDLGTANTVLATPSMQSGSFTTSAATINYLNTGGDAHFGGGITFPGLSFNVDQDNFAMEATGVLTIPTTGNWTFGVNSDDGFRLTIGANSMEYGGTRGPDDTVQTFFLTAGDYPVRLVFFECGGGSEVEVFAGQGSYGGFDSSFRLIGDTSNGGLAVKSLPGGGNNGTLRPLIATDVQTQMWNLASSAYVRIPFAVANPAALSTLTMLVKYDDGFVAYLNGTEVARRNAPVTPLWNSVATNSQPVTNALVYESIDLTSRLSLLKTNGNVLAFHGLNDATDSSDFLILAELMENKITGQTNQYFSTPTPGAVNSTGSDAVVTDLQVSPKRGWFINTNLFITITSLTDGVTIRYTTNGSAPSATNGTVYTGPVTINRTTVLRAVGLHSGFVSSAVDTESYIFLDQIQQQSIATNYVGGSSGDYTLNTGVTQVLPYRQTFTNDLLSVPTLSIVMSWDDLFGPNGVWANTSAYGAAWERPCSLEYMRPDGTKGFQINCGLRIQGGVSRGAIPKHSLRVLFKGIYGASKLTYNLYPDSPVAEFDTLDLHGSFNDHWMDVAGSGATIHRDQWVRDTQNAMGGYGPHGTYVHLYLNGLYWGVYNIGEKGDASYAAHYLGGDKSEYDALNSDELIDGSSDAWNALFALASAGITNDAAYTNISQQLDIPNFIDYLLMNFYAANTDWPSHNWNSARRRAPGSLWHFFSWDAEWTFGLYLDGGDDRTGINYGAPGTLYAALRQHPEFRLQMADHAQKLCFNGGALTPAVAGARWDKRSAELDRAIVGEVARWGAGNTRETWLAANNYVSTWFPGRATVLINQLRNAGLFPLIDAPGLAPFGGLVPPGSSLTLTNPNAAGAIYFTLDGSDPRLWGGGLNPAAQLYAAPITVTNAGIIRARIRNGTTWSTLIEAPFYILQDFSSLALTEIMYHPTDLGTTNGDELEFIEFKNTGTNTLDLTGLFFTDGITFAFTNGTKLTNGQFCVLVRDPAAFAARYPGVPTSGIYTGKLDNAGEKLTLSHTVGTNILTFIYGTTAPWPITPDGYGFSLVRANLAADPGLASAWRASANINGSPGADDPAVNLPGVVINEILTHTDLPEVDSIELYNPEATAANIGGWFLSDDGGKPKKYRVPNGITIPANGYMVFTEANFNTVPGASNSFRLSSHGESLFLFSGDTATNLTGYSHSFEYGASANGVSFGRQIISTGEEFWPAQAALTLGTTNSGPRAGPVVINEIQYHPPAGFDEFVELYNLSATNLPLYSPAFPTNTWRLNGVAYNFPTNTTLAAGSFLLVVPIDPAAFRAKYGVPGGVPILGPYPGALQGNGERIALECPDTPDVTGVPYIVVDEVRYNDKAPWPVNADGTGASLQRLHPADYGNEPTNWFASGITPGAINTVNQPPLCAIAAPTNGAVFTQPVDILLAAAVSDPDGSVASVDFYDGVIKLGTVTSAPFNFTWTNVSAGAHSLGARARDNRLEETDSAITAITVNPPPVGTGTGLRGDYFDNIDFTGAHLRRADTNVNFDWQLGSPDPSMDVDTFSVRWTGQVQPRFTETYTFYTLSDDGARLWVNNQLLVNDWNDHGTSENSGIITLQAGRLYDIKLEYFEDGGYANVALSWSSPSVPKDIIPTSQLYPPPSTNLPPSIVLTNPVSGSLFLTASTIPLRAIANDPDGAVTNVSFLADSMLLGDGTASAVDYSFASSNPPAGPHQLQAVAVDDEGLSRTSAPVNIAVVFGYVTNQTLIPAGSIWKYRDTGEDLGSAWSGLGFVDTSWSNGPAQLGYGDGDEQTVVGYGPDVNNKYITTYFRRGFAVGSPANFDTLTIRVLRDDGAVTYINGTEVFRDNMPAGDINYLTPASSTVSDDDESSFHALTFDPGVLISGSNVVAVEVHQVNGASSDVSFDLELTGSRTLMAPWITAQPQPATVTVGSNATMNVTTVGTAPLGYQWRLDGANLASKTNQTLNLTGVQTNQAGSYSLIVTNAFGSITSSVAVLTVTLPDTDGDGMPDEWELAHGLNPLVNDANLDPDHDGMSNLREYLAGTDPQDAQSVFRLTLTASADTLSLQLPAVANHAYTIQTCADLASGSWSNQIVIPADATNRMVNLAITNQPLTIFYRAVIPSP